MLMRVPVAPTAQPTAQDHQDMLAYNTVGINSSARLTATATLDANTALSSLDTLPDLGLVTSLDGRY
jgi:hypothetical protein